jgi:hypothetical protein
MMKPPTRGPSDPSPDDPDHASQSRAESAPSGPAGSEIGDAIGRRLRALFDSVAAEPVPERLRELLDELERKAGKAG